jgi:hypothetical protein
MLTLSGKGLMARPANPAAEGRTREVLLPLDQADIKRVAPIVDAITVGVYGSTDDLVVPILAFL